jgi:hypothetical protein
MMRDHIVEHRVFSIFIYIIVLKDSREPGITAEAISDSRRPGETKEKVLVIHWCSYLRARVAKPGQRRWLEGPVS